MLEDVDVVETRGDLDGIDVNAVEFDSRHVEAGAVFCCVPGRASDGHVFAASALAQGAVALVVERPLDLDAAQVVVGAGRARSSMARMACSLFGHPARSLATVGVTGTNGKTTVTHMLAAVLEAGGLATTVVGTLHGERTTPEAPVLQRIMAEARDGGGAALAMEVSSHTLTQARVDGFRFTTAVFTNLSHDHLDHHGTMEAYYDAKASLFTPEHARLGVINADDPWGRRLLAQADIDVVPFEMSEVHDVSSVSGRTTFWWRGRQVALALTGSHQVANALAAATAAVALGVSEDNVAAGLSATPVVPGRFEIVSGGPVTVIVDYAHTPDGLQVALHSARLLAAGHRVWCVFGCGGDRDQAKRTVMGTVATQGADVVVITSDNPRHEDPDAIIEQIVAGVSGPGTVIVEPDRRRAITKAIGDAVDGDVVLVAGKGHETTMDMGDIQMPFDDRSVAAAALKSGSRSGVGGERVP